MRSPSGRRSLDPEGTRKAILEAAVAIFSQNGFSGTSIGNVAARAKVTKSLVQYHFESKEALWLRALAKAVEPFLDAIDQFMASSHGRADLRILLRRRFLLWQSHPATLRMLAWAALDPAPFPPEALGRGPQVWQAAIGSTDGVAPEQMYLALSALDGWFLMKRMYGGVTGHDLSTPGADERFLAELLARVWPEKGGNP